MYGTTLNYDSHFFISGVDASLSARELSGVNSLDIGYQNNSAITKPLGSVRGVTTVAGATNQTVSFSRSLIYDDPVLTFTGESKVMKGSFNYNNNASYGFQSGYLTSYSVNCAVGSVPKVNASFVVYDEMKSGVNATGTTPTNIDIPSQGSITATCDHSTTNRVLGFDYSLSIRKIPYYTIGSETPVEVKHINPIEYSAAVQIDVDDIFLASGFSFFEEGRSDKNLSFSIKGRGGNNLQTLSVPNASLVSEQINASADGSVRLTLNYIGHS